MPASDETLSGNLRRVLTAEAVAELKIEHKVLSARVETLERLFSEFIEAEREDQTLMLEDTWKIDDCELAADEAHHDLSDSIDDNSAHDAEAKDVQPAAQMISDAVTPNSMEAQEPQPEQTVPETAAEAVTEAALNGEIADKSAEKTPLVDETKPADVTARKGKSKEKAAPKDAKALLRDKLVSAKTEEHAAPKAKASSDEQSLEASDIDVRLAEYERRRERQTDSHLKCGINCHDRITCLIMSN